MSPIIYGVCNFKCMIFYTVDYKKLYSTDNGRFRSVVEIYAEICGVTKLTDFDSYKLRFGNSNMPILHFLIHPVLEDPTL